MSVCKGSGRMGRGDSCISLMNQGNFEVKDLITVLLKEFALNAPSRCNYAKITLRFLKCIYVLSSYVWYNGLCVCFLFLLLFLL